MGTRTAATTIAKQARRRGSQHVASRTWTLANLTCVVLVAAVACAGHCASAAASLTSPSVVCRQIQTVRKYRRLFKIGDPQQPGSKEELLPAVVRHFQNLVRSTARNVGRDQDSELTSGLD